MAASKIRIFKKRRSVLAYSVRFRHKKRKRVIRRPPVFAYKVLKLFSNYFELESSLDVFVALH